MRGPRRRAQGFVFRPFQTRSFKARAMSINHPNFGKIADNHIIIFDTLLVEASSCHQLCLGTWTSAAAAAIADGVGGVGDGGDSDSEYRMIT